MIWLTIVQQKGEELELKSFVPLFLPKLLPHFPLDVVLCLLSLLALWVVLLCTIEQLLCYLPKWSSPGVGER